MWAQILLQRTNRKAQRKLQNCLALLVTDPHGDVLLRWSTGEVLLCHLPDGGGALVSGFLIVRELDTHVIPKQGFAVVRVEKVEWQNTCSAWAKAHTSPKHHQALEYR